MRVCPLCNRELGDVNIDEHHLIPKTFKGKETITLHKICHRKIHATFTERELAKRYSTIESIVQHPEIQKFIVWVQKKEPWFYDCSIESVERKKKRRR